MNKTEALKELEECKDMDNPDGHIRADEILVEFLKDNGHAEIADKYKSLAKYIEFWYA